MQSLLGPDGGVARCLGEGYESRPQQVRMAQAVAQCLNDRATLLVEAGTGVGKSFAYLLPAVARIVEHGERVVVATHTISLQEQLIEKDVPLLQRVFGGTDDKPAFSAELVKGRGNYLSVRRLQLASSRQEGIFPDEASQRSLQAIEQWAYLTRDGTLATLPQLERPAVWDRVQSDAGNCMGRKCPNYDKCFYQVARRRMERANLLICNHALFFSDLALRSRGVGFLPDYDHVILDEAHTVEDVASDHFGVSLSEGRVRHLLFTLFNPRVRRGALLGLRLSPEAMAQRDRLLQTVADAGHAADEFFASVAETALGARSAGGGGYGSGGGSDQARSLARRMVENVLSPALAEVSVGLRRLKEACENEEDKFELNAYAERTAEAAEAAEVLIEHSLPGCAYWIESQRPEGGHGGGARITLACSPVEVGPLLARHLFDGRSSVVLTSATLAAAPVSSPPQRRPASRPAPPDADDPPFDDGFSENDARAAPRVHDAFDHCRTRLGCEGALGLLLGSPFDYASLVELHVDRTMPDPRDGGYEQELSRRVLQHIRATDGGAFVLFTSYRTMNGVARLIRPELAKLGMPLWVHGADGSRGTILAEFRKDERSVLLGTASFWQGVDVRGRGLRNVIITRLPFDPPDRPLTRARLELIESRGGNAFMEESLPRAVLRFKQGFGRLVRSATDRGRVVVLDPRLVTARYGKQFIEALPKGVPVVESRASTEQAGW